MKPIIGITTYSGVNDLAPDITEPTQHLPQVYINAVLIAGGVPLLLPPGMEQEDAGACIETLNGLLLPGGPDLNPAMYGEPPYPSTGDPDNLRDMWESFIFAHAMVEDLPILGICRGMQLMNVSTGGSLIQHIEQLPLHQGRRGFIQHDVKIEPASLLGEIMPYEDDPVAVTTRHHQAVARLGEGFATVAWAGDGTIEAIEHTGDERFVIGVQWHPERDSDQSVFGALIAAAEKTM